MDYGCSAFGLYFALEVARLGVPDSLSSNEGKPPAFEPADN